MTRGGRLLPVLGGVLLAAIFIYVGGRLWRHGGGGLAGGEVIRFAHWRLEEPTVNALNTLAREYEQMHPGVRVEQLAVPLRAWRAWLQTQLVGGTAPDLIVAAFGVDEQTLGRHFVPLSAHVDAPNPYNIGTSLEGVPWRETFIDGLSPPNYNANLLEYFAAPISGNTFRLFYNIDLIRQLTGEDRPPQNFSGLEALSAAARAWSQNRGQPMTVLAGAYDRSLPLFDRLFQWQMQMMNPLVDRDRSLTVSFAEMGLGYLDGKWSFDDENPRKVIELVGEVGRMSQPGFLGQRQDDSLFLFLQGRAVAVIGASWDSANISRLAKFQVGVADLPFPRADHPHFGDAGMQRPSEAATALNFSFGLTRASAHPDRAIDFLHFLTSQRANSDFSRASRNIPSVIGVEADEITRSFLPVVEGAVPGFTMVYGTSVRGATNRIYENYLHELTNPGGSADAFLATFEPAYRRALWDDLNRDVRFAWAYVARVESVIGPTVRAAGPEAAHRVSVFLETQNLREATAAQIAYRLAQTRDKP